MARKQTERQRELAERRKAYVPGVKVGDLMVGSWGYDQTNAELWRVKELHGKRVVLEELSHVQVPGSQGFMSCRVTPGEPTGKTKTAILQPGDYAKLNDHCQLRAREVGPRGVYSSWYA